MDTEKTTWRDWHLFFAGRSERALPALAEFEDNLDVPASVCRSLAIFQLGESGGGSVVDEARESKLPGVDRDYAESVALFVEEEHRHADILALCVSAAGGKLLRKHWSARLFVKFRRLAGLRLKIMVLLAAEIIGICYYQLIASKLPDCRIRSLLNELVRDERAHLYFHCQFLHMQCESAWQRQTMRYTWRIMMRVAQQLVLMDHGNALRDLEIDSAAARTRWSRYSEVAELLMCGAAPAAGVEETDPGLASAISP